MDSSSKPSRKCQAILGTCCQQSGEVVQCAVHLVMLNGTSDCIQLGCGQLDMLDVLVYGYEEGLFVGVGSNLGG